MTISPLASLDNFSIFKDLEIRFVSLSFKLLAQLSSYGFTGQKEKSLLTQKWTKVINMVLNKQIMYDNDDDGGGEDGDDDDMMICLQYLT